MEVPDFGDMLNEPLAEDVWAPSPIGEKIHCTYCGKSFETASQWRSHIRVHQFKKPHPCMRCGACFGLPGELEAHASSAHIGTDCHRCGYVAKTHAELVAHVLRHFSKCKWCKGYIPRGIDFRLHQLTHPEFVTYPCQVCGKVFYDKYRGKQHLQRKHAGNSLNSF